jgi:hypothetical protein
MLRRWCMTPILCATAAAVILGCAIPEGQDCRFGRTVPDCPDGYQCVSPDGSRGVCMQECVTRGDCASPKTCLVADPSVPRVCWIGGNASTGSSCSDYERGAVPEDPCGPGLVCDTRGTRECAAACDPRSPHSIDRDCPEGFTCDLEDNEAAAVCLQLCDPAASASCGDRPYHRCIRSVHPLLGEIGLCRTRGPFQYCSESGVMCGSGQVCVDDACLSPADAPAVPLRVARDVPPLVD